MAEYTVSTFDEYVGHSGSRTVVSDAAPLPTAPINGQVGVAGGSGVTGATTQRVVLATDVALPAGTNNIGDVDVLSIAAGENHLGQVGTGGNVVQVTPVLDTLAYTANDVLFGATEVAGAVRVSGGRAKLVSLTWLDEDDQAAAAIAIYLTRSAVGVGTANAAPDISDANARELLGHIVLAAADLIDLGGCKFACLENLGIIVKPTTGTSIWISATTAGTPTHTASGIKIGLGFEYL